MNIRYYLSISNILYRIKTSNFARQVVETYATRIILIFLGIGSSIITARVLGPAGRGELVAANALAAICVQFSNVGLHSVNVFYVSKDKNLLSALLGNSILVSFGLGSIVFVSVYLFLQLFSNLAPVSGEILLLALLWIPFGLASLFSQNLLIGIGKIRICNIAEVVVKSLVIICVVIFYFFKLIKVENILIAQLVIIAIQVFIFKSVLFRAAKGIKKSLSLLKKGLPYSLKSYLGSLSSFLLLKFDMMMVISILGKEKAGIYSIAVVMADMIYMFNTVVCTIFFPKVTAVSDIKEKWRLTKKVLLVTSSIVFCISIGVMFFVKQLVVLLYGERYIDSVYALYILLPGIFLYSISGILGNFIASINIPASGWIFGMFVTAINVSLNLLFLEKYGIQGAALSSLICYSLFIPYALLYVFKLLKKPGYTIRW